MNKQADKDVVVFYHAKCPDGFGGAWTAWKKFNDTAEYIGIKNDHNDFNDIKGKEIYFIDISPPVDVFKNLRDDNKKVIIIDHHITNKKIATSSPDNVFNVEHSGSVLAWKYFFPKKNTPLFLRYIEDVDIWNLKLPNTWEVSEIIKVYEKDFLVWDMLVSDFEDPDTRSKHIKEGGILLKKLNKDVKDIVERAEEVEFEGYRCLMVNSAVNVSEIGHALTEKLPPIGIVWSRRKDKVIVSLRSDGSVDVAKLAEKYGGGGHKSAAAFRREHKKLFDFINYDIYSQK